MPENVRNVLHQGDNSILLSLALLCAMLILSVLLLYALWRITATNRRITALTRGVENVNLEQMLASYFGKVEATEGKIDLIEHALAVSQAQIPGCIQRVNMLRYDAFEDVGGKQSFSLALLDGTGDGLVLTSVYSRLEIRVYAKAIRNGKASHPLSDEESQVLRDAATNA